MPYKPIYLDYAAATPIDDRVLVAMRSYLEDQFYNPSALYSVAGQVRTSLQAARADIAQILGARPSEIIFTAGGTESDNLAVQGIMRRFPAANVVVSAIEHEAVLAPAAQFDCRQVTLQTDGRLDIEQLATTIDDKTVLVSIMYANNEIGTVQPIREIGQLIHKTRDARRQAGNSMPLYFHSDACQAANYLDLQVARLGVDLLTLNGSKIYGPKQSGILYVRGGIELEPLIYGGGQERGLRSGTENVAASVGFAKALQLVQADHLNERQRLQELQTGFFKELTDRLPATIINGSLKYRLPNNLHLTLPGIDNERLLIQLDQAGILAAAGSACSASDDTPSHVLRAIGLSDDAARASLRLTMGRQTTNEQIALTVRTLVSLVA